MTSGNSSREPADASASTTAAALSADANPFVGPRALLRGEQLYGRDEEVRDLCNRLQARRIVVLHSPSGAGKSSLVQAGLIPRLKDAGFDIWKVIRVNLDPSGLDVPPSTNRYLLSAMISLEDELPEGRRRSPAELARLDFAQYLETRPRRKGRAGQKLVLIFDQFEEVFTTDPLAVDAKRELFTRVGEALMNRNVWALFALREDYLGQLAPYRELIPTQLSNSFRLDLLDTDKAREVAVKLAERGGRSFPAAEQLIRDLSAVNVQRPDGTFETQSGRYVEPVHLQVVCRRLWAKMPEDDRSIDPEDIEKYGAVSSSLAGYYADTIAKIAGGNLAVERAIREWIGNKLIVGSIRSQVRQEQGQSAGLDNELIHALVSSYLVRAELRAGATWFELSHDRLVEPALEDNEAWERRHLHPVQLRARQWEDGRRSRGLLLTAGAEDLDEIERWASVNAALLTESEQDFLAQSWAQIKSERSTARRSLLLTMGAIATAIVMAGLASWAFLQSRELSSTNDELSGANARLEQSTQALEREKQTAEQQSRIAQEQSRIAQQQRRTAEELQQSNAALQLTLFQAALRPGFIAQLELTDLGGVSAEGWISLLTKPNSSDDLMIATSLPNGGRIAVAGSSEVLSVVDDGRRASLFLEIMLRWLAGERGKRVVVVADTPKPPPNLAKILLGLGYELTFLSIPKDRIGETTLADAAVLILDNSSVPFGADELEHVETFVRAGGGLLAVGTGLEWPAAEILDYPMNKALAPFHARWTGRRIHEASKQSDPTAPLLQSLRNRDVLTQESETKRIAVRCVESFPIPGDHMKIAFHVKPDGQPEQIVITPTGAQASDCVRDKLQRKRFPKSRAGGAIQWKVEL